MHESCIGLVKNHEFHAYVHRVYVLFLGFNSVPCFWSCRCVTREPKSSIKLERKQSGGEELQLICICAKLFAYENLFFFSNLCVKFRYVPVVGFSCSLAF